MDANNPVQSGLMSLFVSVVLAAPIAIGGAPHASILDNFTHFLLISGVLFGLILMMEFAVRNLAAQKNDKPHPAAALLIVSFSALITVFFFLGLVVMRG